MFKQLMTLLRGVAYQTGEAVTDRHALPILAQQIREAARGVDAARKAVALAMAQSQEEVESSRHLSSQIADLEARAIAALSAGQEGLAREAADAIALLETELECSRRAQADYSGCIEKLKTAVRNSELRLLALQRGERIATARDRTQRLTHEIPGNELATLDDAEATLSRLQRRQQEIDLTATALTALKQTGKPASVIEKLANAGYGAPLAATGEDVLKRLRDKAASAHAAKA